MKKVLIYFCVFGLVSCSKEELLPAGSPAGDDPLAVTFAGGSSRGEWIGSPQASARATDTSWKQDDRIGIYMLPSGNYNLTSAVWKNKEYTVTASGTLSPNGTANTLYYPVNGDNVRFVAYYPYSGAVNNNKVNFDFTDQSAQDKKEAVDLCFHRGTMDYSRSGTAGLALKFQHKFSKILMTVTSGTGGPASVRNVAVTLDGMPKTATANLNRLARQQADSIQVADAAANVTTIQAFTHSASTDAEATVEAIVAPHSGTGNFAGRVFTFTIGSDVRKYALPDDVKFESGKLYHFNFTLMKGITVADGKSNCYIVAPNSTLKFYVSRAYIGDASTDKLRVDPTGGDYTGGFEAAVLWEDAADLIVGTPTVAGTGKKAVVTVKTNNAYGNAVVAIKKAETIVWSYHIWVTDYTPDETNTHKNLRNGLVFMDRNLGAKANDLSEDAYGLYYQWGRKDPFTGINIETVAKTTSTGNIEYCIKNPTKFITGAGTWLNDPDITLWGGDGGGKTVYDPCPNGWRVPPAQKGDRYGPWWGLTNDSNATFTIGNLKQPPAGRINIHTGICEWKDVRAYAWTALHHEESDNQAYCFSVEVSAGHQQYHIALGNSVRCIEE
jgi:hypothetical protein